MFQGISRSLQGPTLLELQKQVGVSIQTFQIVFLLGTITFPSGNFLGNQSARSITNENIGHVFCSYLRIVKEQ